MARKNGPGFKMKRSPAKGLSNFFSSLGKELKSGQKERGIFSEKGKAEKKEMRKTGESKYQYDVRKRRERSRQAKNDKLVTSTSEQSQGINPKSEVKIDPKVGMDRYTYKTTPKAKATPKSKLSGSGTDARKKQYDAKGWKYDDTIKGYNKDGSRKKFVVQTDVTKNKKGVLTPNTKSFNTAEEQNAFIAANKGSFGYKIDDKGNRIKKEKEKKTNNPPPTNIATEETVKKDSNVLTQVLKPGFMHASDMINKGFAKPGVGFDFNKTNDYSSPVEKKSPYKKGIGSYAKKAKGSRGYKMKRNK